MFSFVFDLIDLPFLIWLTQVKTASKKLTALLPAIHPLDQCRQRFVRGSRIICQIARFGWINILRPTDLSEWKADTLGGTIGSPFAKQVGAPETSFCPTVFFLSGVGFIQFVDRSLMRCRCRCPQTTLVCFVEFE